MTKIEWPGIPESYWPDTEKPWRVTYSLGAFEDFKSKEAALKFYEGLDANQNPSEPFDVREAVV